MSNTTIAARWQAWAPYILSVMRIVAAAIFLSAGTTILFGWPAAMPQGVKFTLWSQMGLGGVLEFAGGLLLLLGLGARPVAFILSGMMAVAYFQFHLPQSPWPTVNQGIPAILFCFVWLYISAVGPGPWSLDAALKKK